MMQLCTRAISDAEDVNWSVCPVSEAGVGIRDIGPFSQEYFCEVDPRLDMLMSSFSDIMFTVVGAVTVCVAVVVDIVPMNVRRVLIITIA